MTENFFSSRIKFIQDSNPASNDERSYKIITVRPGDEATALIDVLTEINDNKIPLTRITDIISEELAKFIEGRRDCAETVFKVLNEKRLWDQHSAFGILEKDGFIERVRQHFEIGLKQ